MTSQNGQKVTEPAQLVYYNNDPTLTISFMDTTERYTVVRNTKHNGATILKVMSGGCEGYIYIMCQHRGRGESTGTVWFFSYCKGKRIERMFSVNPRKCYTLMKKHRKEMKKTLG